VVRASPAADRTKMSRDNPGRQGNQGISRKGAKGAKQTQAPHPVALKWRLARLRT